MRLLKKFYGSLTAVRLVALLAIVILAVSSFTAPYFSGFDPYGQDIAHRFSDPGQNNFLLGSDELGRDTLARLLYGVRIELIIAFSATGIAMVAGTLLGLLSGYYSRLGELLLMRVVDVILSFPAIIIALLATALYGHSEVTLVIVLGFLFVPNFARVVYGQVLAIVPLEYVEASRVFGASTRQRVFSVILPNCLTPIIVQFTTVMATAVLLESGLSFLGLGVVPPEPSLGSMVASAQRYMSANPDQLLLPGVVVSGMILCFGVLGDFLRDVLDPRM